MNALTRHGLKCAAENTIAANLLTLPDAQQFLFSALRAELPDDCRDTLDALEIVARAIDYDKPEDERYNAADLLMKCADKLAQSVTAGEY